MAHEPAATCPDCGVPRSAGANFCANCGRGLHGEAEPVSYVSSAPRLFGVLSPLAAFVLASLLLVGAIAALFAASPILAILMFALAGAAFVLFYGAAERDPSTRVARAAVIAKNRVRGWTSFTAGSAGAWTRAGRELMRLRSEVRTLSAERGQLQLALGDAAYRGDEASVAALVKKMRELDQEVASRESAKLEALARARNRVADERLAVHHTEVISPGEADSTSGPAER